MQRLWSSNRSERTRYVPNLTVTWRGGRWLLGTVPCMRVMCVGGHVPTSRFSLGSKYLASTRQVFSGSNKRGRSAVVPTHPPGDSLFICRPIQKLIQQAEACQALFCPALGPALSCPVLSCHFAMITMLCIHGWMRCSDADEWLAGRMMGG